MKNNVEMTVNKNATPLVVASIVVLVGVVVFFSFQTNPLGKKTPLQKNNPQQEAKQLVDTINSLYDLPRGENPTIATVSDKIQLQKQAFFAKAENGDKVLIYTNAKKAILYRPSTHKIIEAAPFVLGVQTPSPLPIPTKKIMVSIYNGTKKSGLTTAAEKQLNIKYNNIEVIEKTDAKNDYTATIVIDRTNKNGDAAKGIADLFGGTVGTLSQDEKLPKGDILIILGK